VSRRRQAVPDVIGPDLKVLFCGINPGIYSAQTGFHFARPGNRFWPVLHAAGFTPRRFDPSEEWDLVPLGWGVTNLVHRPSVAASELDRSELVAGARGLARKVRRWRPHTVAVLGIGAYRAGFGRPKARAGLQPEPLAGARIWLLPNPSGLNANYRPAELAALFRELRSSVSTD
jgi:TDG/mug DNA glycosylase family protein